MSATATADLRFGQDVPLQLRAGAIHWLGALSFEERCTGSVMALARGGVRIVAASLLDYGTRIEPEPLGAELKRRHSGFIAENLATGRRGLVPHSTDGHSAFGFTQILRTALSNAVTSGGTLVVDITCLTRVHTMVAAAELAVLRSETPIVVAYTLPESYVTMAEYRRDFQGFKQPVVLPLVRGATLREESRARGVIVPGHESRRLLLALGEMEPAGGSVIITSTKSRPDFEHVTRYRNRATLARLERELGTWKQHRIPFSDGSAAAEIVRWEGDKADANNAPLLLYPFGAKSTVFAVATAAAVEYGRASWFVYPTPSFYDPNATEGVGTTWWLVVHCGG